MDRYLTAEECAEELRVSKPVVLKLLKKGQLTGIEIAPGHFRILDPAPKLRERLLDDPLEHFPFISKFEVAEIMDMNPVTVKWYVDEKITNPVWVKDGPHFRVFTPLEVRKFAAYRERLRGPRRLIYSSAIARWLKAYLEKDANATAESIQTMLDKAARLPEPKRSQIFVQIWALLDELNLLLREASGIERREPKPPPHTSPHHT